MKKNRAFLKWAGGKYPLVEEIRRYLPAGDCLIEPFVGAGSVFLNTEYDRYILADINSDLINLYDIVKTQTDDFIRDARELFTDEHNVAEMFYLLRDEFNLCAVPYRRAVLFLYLNRHCYNGLCRYNMRGEFNVPFGCYKKPYFPRKSYAGSPTRRAMPLLFVSIISKRCSKRLRERWSIAIHRMLRFPPRRILRRITPIISTTSINRAWRRWRIDCRWRMPFLC